MKTLSEKLSGKSGEKILCDICKRKQVFTYRWMMTNDRLLVCPDCQVDAKNTVMVNII